MMTRIVFVILLAMPALVSVNSTAIAQGPKTIDVSGHGDSSAKPDMMTLSFAVTARSDSADECTQKESETSRRVVDALKATLGESAKIITSDFSFNPSIEYGNGLATPTPIVMGAGDAANPAEPPVTWQFKGQVDAFSDSMEPIADLIETGMAAGATSVADSSVAQIPEDWDPTAPAISPAAC